MSNQQSNDIYFDEQEGNTLKDYIILLRNNLPAVLIILLASIAISVLYALRSPDIYISQAGVKITKSGGNILQSPFTTEFSDFGSDRFIANEIEILKSYNLRERVAESLLDTFLLLGKPDRYSLLIEDEGGLVNDSRKITSKENLIRKLEKAVSIEQKRGLDIITISVESQSPEEAAFVANTYANVYKDYNLEIN
ncbi:MAG: Wzz/FepE/Etk N-terminal domain-containing protein, partial [Ignavibacterium sp.]